MSKIYTKTGDQGETSLLGGKRVPKNHPQIEAYGTIDELNTCLGLICCEMIKWDNLKNSALNLECLQHWLFDLGSLLATEKKDHEKYKLNPITLEQVQFLEKQIDGMNEQVLPLRQFILPFGCEVSCRIHLARTVARRAERCMLSIKDSCPSNSIEFINRLSDFLFVLARFCNAKMGVKEICWEKKKLL